MTYYILLLLALALAALGYFLRRRSAFWGQAMILVGCAGCFACVFWQVRQTLFTPEAKGPDRGQAVVGYFLANQVLSQIPGTEGSVVLFFPPESVLDSEKVGTYAGTFSRVLRGCPGLKVHVLTLAVPDRAARAGRIPLASFQQAASNAPPALAYVSFAGVPSDIEKFGRKEQSSPPSFFVFDPWGTTNWLAALKSSRVKTVIIPRPDVHAEPGEEISGEPGEVFKQLYLIATPATADDIAGKMGVK
jgi:hypothetical protein